MLHFGNHTSVKRSHDGWADIAEGSDRSHKQAADVLQTIALWIKEARPESGAENKGVMVY